MGRLAVSVSVPTVSLPSIMGSIRIRNGIAKDKDINAFKLRRGRLRKTDTNTGNTNCKNYKKSPISQNVKLDIPDIKNSIICIAGPKSSIFAPCGNGKMSEKTDENGLQPPKILFPYRKDPSTPGSLLIVDDYNTIDGVMAVPLGKTKEFASRLDNCDPVLSGIMFSNYIETIEIERRSSVPDTEVQLAINNSYDFVNYIDEQALDITNAIRQIVPHETDFDATGMPVLRDNNLIENSETLVNDLEDAMVENFIHHESNLNPTTEESDLEPLVTINLVEVKVMDGFKATFKITRASVIEETIKVYCQNILNRSAADLLFFYKNSLIRPSDTVQSLHMKENDEIRCFDAKFIETYTVNCLVPFMERHGLTTKPGSLIDELLSISPSFPNGLKSVKNKKKGNGGGNFLASLSDQDFKNRMSRLRSLSRRKYYQITSK